MSVLPPNGTIDLAKLDAHTILAKYGTSYAWATKLLPKKHRNDIETLYAWVRLLDEMVDSTPKGSDPKELLTKWRTEWTKVVRLQKNDPTAPMVMSQAAELFQRKGIPAAYIEAFLDSMEQDLNKTRYGSYGELAEYMYGSAAVVGRMICRIIGVTGEQQSEGEAGSDALGYAMQLTNFLRDVGEDYQERGRIYLPEDEMVEYGVNENIIKQGVVTESFVRLMKMNIARTRDLYREANRAIRLLPKDCRFGILTASKLYEAILGEIERNSYDVFRKRARTSLLTKVRLTLSARFSKETR